MPGMYACKTYYLFGVTSRTILGGTKKSGQSRAGRSLYPGQLYVVVRYYPSGGEVTNRQQQEDVARTNLEMCKSSKAFHFKRQDRIAKKCVFGSLPAASTV